MVQINASAGNTYYFALGMARQLDNNGQARVGNGAPPQIVVSEIQS